MKKTSTFQTIILVTFGAFIVIGMGYFSLGGGKSKGDASALKKDVVIWGTLPSNIVTEALQSVFPKNADKIRYKQKRSDSFDSDLIEALASSKGPDMILLPQNLILRYTDKVYTIPYQSMSVRSFKDRFIREGELYLNKNGILAIPMTIDPMVMYWNRNIFSSAGISIPPKYWDEFYKITDRLTTKDSRSNISRSTISFGEFKNVAYAKDILSMLIVQAGDPITTRSSISKSGVASVFGGMFGNDIAPAISALYFYTGFSNPTKSIYSWNKSLPNSFDMFTEGNLAVYFGFASNLSAIRQKNPNLNFDVVEVPQTRNTKDRVTFGRMQGLSILKQSKNIGSAFKVAIMLSSPKFISALSGALNLPPVRRDLLFKKPANPYLSLFYNSALTSRAWLDPSPVATEAIFKRMVEDIVSGKTTVGRAVLFANAGIQSLLK